MITTSGYQTQFGLLTNNSSSDNQSLGLLLTNQTLRYLTGKLFMNERTYTTTTVANQQFYNMPPQVKRLIDVTVTVGTVVWTLKLCPSREYWDMLNVIPFVQDFPTFFFPYGQNQVGIWPTPATTGNAITMNHAARTTDLSQADYVAGTVSLPYTATLTAPPAIGDTSATLSSPWALATGLYQVVFSDNEMQTVTLTNGSAAVSWTTPLTGVSTTTITVNGAAGGTIVIGATTSWVPNMSNRWFQLAAPTGDNQWYQIASAPSSTQIVLLNQYTGPAASGASSYIIGETPLLPEDYQDLALFRPLWIYFTSIVPDQSRATIYKDLYENGYNMLVSEFGQKSTSPVLTDMDAPIYNPNLFVRSISQSP